MEVVIVDGDEDASTLETADTPEEAPTATKRHAHSGVEKWRAMRLFIGGMNLREVANQIGVCYDTAKKWKQRGEPVNWDWYADRRAQILAEVNAEQDAAELALWREHQRDTGRPLYAKFAREAEGHQTRDATEAMRCLKTAAEMTNEGFGEAGSTVGVKADVEVNPDHIVALLRQHGPAIRRTLKEQEQELAEPSGGSEEGDIDDRG